MNPFALTLTSQIATSAPRDVVRRVFMDAASWPDWCGPVREVLASPEHWRVGERLCYRLQSVVSVVFDVRLDAVEDGLVRWSSRKGPILGTRTFEFADGVIRDTKLFESVLPVSLFYPRPPIRKMSERWLADLAAESERRMT